MVQIGTACYGQRAGQRELDSLLSRILVIDDDRAVCAAVAGLLAKLGHESVLASNTIDGIAAAEGGAIDVALIDMNMPGLDGLEAVKAIARIEPQIPVIGMSGGSTSTSAEDYAILAVNFGAALFLPKPFSSEQLRRAITTVLSASTAR
jgi:DNA-binding NtrC family response regulator